MLSENENIWPANTLPFSTTTTLLSSTNPLLEDGVSCWVMMDTTVAPNTLPLVSVASYRWFINNTLTTTPYLSDSDTTGSFAVDPWTGANNLEHVAFRVEGEPTAAVPETRRA